MDKNTKAIKAIATAQYIKFLMKQGFTAQQAQATAKKYAR